MKKLLLNLNTLLLLLCAFSCNETPKTADKEVATETTATNPKYEALEKNFMRWWTYYSNNIILSLDFEAKDTDGTLLDKETFLRKLTSGNFIPVKTEKGTQPKYQLYKLTENADKGIPTTIASEAKEALKNFKLEGTNFPKFSFTDLEGNVYTNENTKGKTILFKTWFINCAACVAEFPELNELVAKYKDRDDILFISLAKDEAQPLKEFLKKKEFNYKVIPDVDGFISHVLEVKISPTHFVVDGNGKIQKVVTNANEMISFLENKKVLAQETNTLPPPPPPPGM